MPVKTTKSEIEQEYIRRSFAKVEMTSYELADKIGRNQSNISRFICGSLLADDAVEAIYNLGIVKRPSKEDLATLEKELLYKNDKIQYVGTSSLSPHPVNHKIYGDECDDELLESINKKGIQAPLLVADTSPAKTIISGHRRYSAAKKLGLEAVPVIVITEMDELHLEELLIINNKQRQKTAEQIAREYKKLKEIEEKRAKNRMSEGGKGVVNSPHLSKDKNKGKKSRDIAAEKLGVGAQKAERAAKVVAAIDTLDNVGKKDEANKLRETLNKKSVNAAYEEIKPKKKKSKPEGDFIKEMAKDETAYIATQKPEEDFEQFTATASWEMIETELLKRENEKLRRENEDLQRKVNELSARIAQQKVAKNEEKEKIAQLKQENKELKKQLGEFVSNLAI